MVEAGTVLQNRYRVEKQIGAGGMGTVYLATDQRFDSPVAIKETLFKDEDLQRAFEREAQLLNRLRHPALPRVIDYFAEGDGQFLVMEYITGADLSAILKQTKIFSVRDVLRWADELLSALEYLHSQTPPVVHRDIKPQNLKLTTTGEIILLDFGLAKGKTGDTSQLSITNSVFGYSRSYAPLEQIQGTGTDLRSDVYSLAATLYHLFTGKPPVDALTRATSYVNQQPDPLRPANELNPQIPAPVAEVLAKALELNAGLRWKSVAAMRAALRAVTTEFAADAFVNDAEQQTNSQLADDHEVTKVSRNKSNLATATAALAVEPQRIIASPAISEKVEPESSLNDFGTPSIRISSSRNSTAAKQRFNGRRDIEAVQFPGSAWKTPLIIAAAILILGGGLALWAATSQPIASQSNVQATTAVNANATDNRSLQKPLETTKTVVNSSAVGSPALSVNSNIQVIPQAAPSVQTIEAKRPEIVVKSVSDDDNASRTKANEDIQEAEVKKPATTTPPPIVVRSAPPTVPPRRKSADDNSNEPREKPRSDDGASGDDDNPSQANVRRTPRRTNEDQDANQDDTRQRRVRENRQKLPTILGAPPDNQQ